MISKESMDTKEKKIRAEIEELKKLDYSLLDETESFMLNGLLNGFISSINKIRVTFYKQVLLGILSGIILGFGYTACIVASNSLPQFLKESGLGNILMGLIFPGCIILITFLGGGLFTSHVVATIPWLKKAVTTKEYLNGIFGVLIGNLLGTLVFVIVFLVGGGLLLKIGSNNSSVSFMDAAYESGIKKLYELSSFVKSNSNNYTSKIIFLSILYSFGGAILCNIMVSSTLQLTNSTKNHAAVFLLMIFPIFFFVISGYQHGPANTFFFWIIIARNIFNPENSHVTEIILFLFVSLIPTLFGNWVGGSFVIPGILSLVNKKHTNLLFKKERITLLKNKLSNNKNNKHSIN